MMYHWLAANVIGEDFIAVHMTLGAVNEWSTQACRRLERSRRARKVTRFVLKTWWAPVGSSIMPRAETAFLLRYLMGGPDGARVAGQLDEKIDRLPGLADLQLVRRATSGYGVGPGPDRSVPRPGPQLGTVLPFPTVSR